MTPHQVEPDDEISRFAAVYLGPAGFGFPWAVRYTAYGTGLVIFAAIITAEAVIPGLSVGLPPVWEAAVTILTTAVIMLAVDYDRPALAVVHNIVTVARVRHHHPTRTQVTAPAMRDIKIDRSPL